MRKKVRDSKLGSLSNREIQMRIRMIRETRVPKYRSTQAGRGIKTIGKQHAFSAGSFKRALIDDIRDRKEGGGSMKYAHARKLQS